MALIPKRQHAGVKRSIVLTRDVPRVLGTNGGEHLPNVQTWSRN